MKTKTIIYIITRVGEPPKHLWDDGYRCSLKFKFLGFYVIKCEKEI